MDIVNRSTKVKSHHSYIPGANLAAMEAVRIALQGPQYSAAFCCRTNGPSTLIYGLILDLSGLVI